jgi:hypothetical protein
MLIITAWVRNPNRAKSLQTKPIKQARRKAAFFIGARSGYAHRL